MTPRAGPLRILVVDDEPAILRFLHASQLIDTERFRDIVIGAKIERCDLGAFVLTI